MQSAIICWPIDVYAGDRLSTHYALFSFKPPLARTSLAHPICITSSESKGLEGMGSLEFLAEQVLLAASRGDRCSYEFQPRLVYQMTFGALENSSFGATAHDWQYVHPRPFSEQERKDIRDLALEAFSRRNKERSNYNLQL